MTIMAGTKRDQLEAECRRLMAELHRTPARGWDSERKRARMLAALDLLLDEWQDA